MLKMTTDFVTNSETNDEIEKDVKAHYNKVHSIKVIKTSDQSPSGFPELEITFDVKDIPEFNKEVAQPLFDAGIEDAENMADVFNTLQAV